jgi:drug/metabolite transporter (DMT)-like permease
MIPSSLWIVFTIAAAVAQTLRNAMQRELITALGAIGATQVRFLFGLPFALVILATLRFATGVTVPTPGAASILWAVFGALSQIAATALMLSAMRDRSFVVTIAYTKTEAIQVALFSLIFLGEKPTPALLLAIGLATLGVFLLSWPRAVPGEAAISLKPAGLGLLSATFFAFAAIGFRGAVTSVDSTSYVMAASVILVVGLAMQTGALLLYLLIADRKGLQAIIDAWRGSIFAGLLGAVASEFWFLAFALTTAARVRTLALIEVIFAQVVSLRMFREGVSRRETAGMALVVAAILVLVNA